VISRPRAVRRGSAGREALDDAGEEPLVLLDREAEAGHDGQRSAAPVLAGHR
jgi:hypothetical protein